MPELRVVARREGEWMALESRTLSPPLTLVVVDEAGREVERVDVPIRDGTLIVTGQLIFWTWARRDWPEGGHMAPC